MDFFDAIEATPVCTLFQSVNKNQLYSSLDNPSASLRLVDYGLQRYESTKRNMPIFHFNRYFLSLYQLVMIYLFISGSVVDKSWAGFIGINQLNRATRKREEVASNEHRHPDFSSIYFKPTTNEIDPIDYLKRFGYLSGYKPTATLFSDAPVELEQIVAEADVIREAVLRFQHFAGLPATGTLDEATRKLMLAPRCGVPDVIYNQEMKQWSTTTLEREQQKFDDDQLSENVLSSAKSMDTNPIRRRGKHFLLRRTKRYAIQGSRWKTKDLVWKVTKYTDKLPKNTVDQVFGRALQIWANASQLTFRQAAAGSDDDANINIKFATGAHGDKEPFDGPGGILAHAFFPMFGGAAHFDDAEDWTDGTPRGTNLYQVAAHEFGHSLGLSHSNVRSAIMAPFYRGYNDKTHLDQDDIGGIEYLYGENSNVINTRNEKGDYYDDYYGWNGGDKDNDEGGKVPDVSKNDVCHRPLTVKIDAITRVADGSVYGFLGKFYYKLNSRGEFDLDDNYYPRRISADWPGVSVTAVVDAALTWADGKTFIFLGDKYWRFHNRKPMPGYPKLISEGFQGIPDNIDAAFVWPGNGATYFTKGYKFWRYDSQRDEPVPPDYPRDLGSWNGVPRRIDSGFVWKNERTYLFSGPNYYRVQNDDDDAETATTLFTAENGYPRLTASGWFGCQILKSDFLPATTTAAPSLTTTTTERAIVIIGTDTLQVSATTPATTTTQTPQTTTTTAEPTTTEKPSSTTTEKVQLKPENPPPFTTQIYEFVEPDKNADEKVWFVYRSDNDYGVFPVNNDGGRNGDDSRTYGNQQRVYFNNAAAGAYKPERLILIFQIAYALILFFRPVAFCR